MNPCAANCAASCSEPGIRAASFKSEVAGETKTYPFSELEQTSTPLSDQLAGKEVIVEIGAGHRIGRTLDASAEELPSVMVFWFAWAAFHPDTEVFTVGSVR